MRKRGRLYEDIACDYLRSIGYKVIYRNYMCSYSEIDIIALDGDIIVFVEVKGANSLYFGHPALKVTSGKLKKIRECIKEFFNRERHPSRGCRIDVITIVGNRVEHIKDINLL